MRTLWWVIVATVGWSMMWMAYATRAQTDESAPWSHGIVVVGPELPVDLAGIGRATHVRFRLVPDVERTERLIRVVSQISMDEALRLGLQLRPKLFPLALKDAGIDGSSLQSGRLPETGRDEIVAGALARLKDHLTVDNRELKVVGVLKPEFTLVQDDYLIPESDAANGFFSAVDPLVHTATLVQLTSAQSQDRSLLQKLARTLRAPNYLMIAPLPWLAPATSSFYLAGLAVFLLGGSGSLIGIFRGLAAWARRPSLGEREDELDGIGKSVTSKAQPGWWAAPLLEFERRPSLVWAVHLVYFGLVIAGSILISFLPEIQTALLSSARDALSASSGPLARAAEAYASGNIARAAAVTFLINFFLGSLLMLTLPSVILPGSGIFVAAIRSVTWGLLFSPTIGSLAYSMLPHSGTMLLEGEGYILATLFGLLIPIHILQSSLGGTPLARFGRVLWLNVLGNFWVAVVLAVAACYEATEVILMNR